MALIPYVIEKEAGGERSYDLYSRMLKDRVIFMTGPVEDNMAMSICAQMQFLDYQDQNEPIKLYINSPGGVVTAGLAIYDTMRTVKSPVHTIVVGQAASMGTLIATAGQKGHRYITAESRFMIHQPSGGYRGQATDIMIHAKETEVLKKRLTDIYVRHNARGKTYDEFFTALERDNFMSAEQAIEFGIVDVMIEPKPI